MFIPIRLQYRRNSFLPVMQIIGSSTVGEAEGFVISKVVEAIEIASKFKGRPTCMSEPKAESMQNYKIVVVTEIIFPKESDLREFEKNLKP